MSTLQSCVYYTQKILFLELQPRIRGWLLASVDGNKEGFIPANYIRVLGKRKGSRHMAKMTQDVEVPTTQVPCAEDTRWDGARPKTSSSEDQTSTQQMCEAQPASSSNRVGSGDSSDNPLDGLWNQQGVNILDEKQPEL